STFGSACTSSFSRFAQRSLALRPAHSHGHQFVTAIRGLQPFFVACMPAPVASGRSGRRVGLAPTGKRRLVTAHVESRHILHSLCSALHSLCSALTAKRKTNSRR